MLKIYSSYGGGISILDSSAVINKSSIARNSLGSTGCSGASIGGGICSRDSRLTITKSSILQNTVSGTKAYGGGVAIKGEDDSSTLIDNTLIVGNSVICASANDSEDVMLKGGGVFFDGSSGSITNSKIKNNKIASSVNRVSLFGAGAAIQDSNVQITSSAFISNSVKSLTGYGHGGAISNVGGNMELDDCDIKSNSVVAFQSSGGGIYSYGGIYNSHISNSSITGNIADGGAVARDDGLGNGMATGGGVAGYGVTVTKSVISKNKAMSAFGARGGGLYGATVLSSDISNNMIIGWYNWTYNTTGSAAFGATIVNSIIKKNKSVVKSDIPYGVGNTLSGLSGFAVGQSNLVNCNVTENMTNGGFSAGVSGDIINSIVWDNISKTNPALANLAAGNVVNSFVDISGGFLGALDDLIAQLSINDSPSMLDSSNILAEEFDFKFVAPGKGDYSIQYNSLLRDAGTNDVGGSYYYWDLIAAEYASDYDGNNRRINTIDIGMCEYQAEDVDGDGFCDTQNTLLVTKNSSAVYHDHEDHRVKISLSCPGECEVVLPGDDYCNPTLISLSGTTDKTKLIITSGKGTVIENIVADGDLWTIIAGNVELSGNINVSGTLHKLVLGDVDSAQQQEILLNTAGGGISEKHKLVMNFKQISDVTVNTGGMGVESMKMTGWLDLDGEVADELVAPWAGNIKSCGKANDGVIDFQADIILSGIGAPKDIALSKFVAQDVAGAWINVDSGQYTGICTVNVASWAGGGIIAPSLDRFIVRGDLDYMEMTLTGSENSLSDKTIANIKGDFTSTNWSLARNLSPLKVKGDISSSSILSDAVFVGIKARSITDTLLDPFAWVRVSKT